MDTLRGKKIFFSITQKKRAKNMDKQKKTYQRLYKEKMKKTEKTEICIWREGGRGGGEERGEIYGMIL